MSALFHTLAQAIAPDVLWSALVLLIVLGILHAVETRRHRADGSSRVMDFFRKVGHKH
jgi:hypothetical protein